MGGKIHGTTQPNLRDAGEPRLSEKVIHGVKTHVQPGQPRTLGMWEQPVSCARAMTVFIGVGQVQLEP